jgi:NAD(P)-dependent dehydrogenase (short-subunit alcohol dehydrogenase family)
MFFSIRNVAVAGLALLAASPISASPVPAAVEARAVTAQQAVENIKTLTTKSQALQGPAQSITIINAPLIIIGQGPFPPIITGFTDIVSTAITAIDQMDGTQPFAAADVTAVADAFREFVRVHQALLNILIGKAGILQQVPIVGAPVAAVLRQVEAVVDTIALGLIHVAETATNDIETQANSLGATLDLAIQKYEGLSL